MEKNGLELLVQNLQRLDHEGKAQGEGGQGGEEDAKGIHATLQVGWRRDDGSICMNTCRVDRINQSFFRSTCRQHLPYQPN